MTRPGARPRYTIHVGNDASFVALYTGPDGENADAHFEVGEPINHVGVQADDLDAIEDKVIAEGLILFLHGDHAPGRRFHVFDPDGIEYEVVSYYGASRPPG